MAIALNDKPARVVYAAVTRMTDDRNLQQQAFTYWYQELSAKAWNIADIVNAVIQYLGLSTAEKKSLYIALQAASNRSAEALPEVPQILQRGLHTAVAAAEEPVSDAAESGVSDNLPAHIQTTVALLVAVAANIRRVDNAAATELAEILGAEGLPEVSIQLAAALMAWGDEGFARLQFPRATQAAECPALFHQFYLLGCEVLGPAELDRALDKAVAEVAASDVGLRFDPRELL